METRNKVLCALGNLAKQAFRQIFSGEDFMNPISCIFSYLENHQQRCLLLVTSINLLPKCVLDCMYPLHKNHIYSNCPLSSLEKFLSAMWASLPGSSPYQAPNKTLSTAFTLYFFFLYVTEIYFFTCIFKFYFFFLKDYKNG